MRTRSGFRWSTCAFLVASVMAACTTVPASAQPEIFAQGHQFYQAEAYSASVEAYPTVRAGGLQRRDRHHHQDAERAR